MEHRFTYKLASRNELETIWNKNIRRNRRDKRWLAWKDEFIANHVSGRSKTFLVLDDGEPVGEGTLLFSPQCSAVNSRTQLADGGKTANINALRIEKVYENQGHISRLIQVMEQFAKENGYRTLTIGVEAQETRNLAIYLHWGYTNFVMAEAEEGNLVLYYSKRF